MYVQCVPTPEQDVKETDFLHAIQSKRPIIKRNSPWLSSLRNFLPRGLFSKEMSSMRGVKSNVEHFEMFRRC
jgi:hypothetical protein